MTPLEEQVQKNNTSIKTISDSLIEYAKDTDLDKSNDNISAKDVYKRQVILISFYLICMNISFSVYQKYRG